MKKYFNVAEYCFAVEFDEKHPFGGHLSNYEPFVCGRGEDCLFSLRFDDNLSRPADVEPLLVGATDPLEPRVDLYQCSEGYWIEFAPNGKMRSVGAMLLPSDGSAARLKVLCSQFERFSIDNALMLLFAFKTSDKGILEIHSSVIAYEGKGYMFLGVSGTGKSTHSRMWLESFPQAELLNDDNPIIRVIDGEAFVYGSPWSGKTPCYKAKKLPVGAIVRIRRAPFNKATELSMPEAYADIYSSTSNFKADLDMANGLHSTIEQTVSSVSCYVLDCLPDHDAAVVCRESVVK